MGLSARAVSAQRLLRRHTQLSRRWLEHLHALRGDKALQERSSAAEAPRRTVINRGPHARGAQMIGLAPVGGHQPPPAAPTHEQADPEGGPCAGSAEGCGDRAVVREALLDRCTPLPADGRWKSLGDQDVAGRRGVDGPSGTPPPRRWLARVSLAMAPAICPRIDWVVQEFLSGHPRRPPPRQVPPVKTRVRAHRHAKGMRHQGAQHALQTPVLLEGLKAQADDPLGLLVWVQMRIAVGSPDIPQGWRIQQCTPPSLVAHPFQHPAFHEGECRFAHHPTQPSQEAIVGVCRIIEALGIGQPRPNDGTECEPLLPVLVRACQATHLQPQDQPDRVTRLWPLWPWSSSMTTTRSRDHPKATARSTKASCLAVDSTCSTTCWGWDWRTYTMAKRCR